MALREWLGGDVQARAKNFVHQLSATFPAELEAVSAQRARALRKQGVEQLLGKVAAFRQDAKPGFVKRIVFARVFQRELAAHGYGSDFIRQLMIAVLAELTKRTGA